MTLIFILVILYATSSLDRTSDFFVGLDIVLSWLFCSQIFFWNHFLFSHVKQFLLIFLLIGRSLKTVLVLILSTHQILNYSFFTECSFSIFASSSVSLSNFHESQHLSRVLKYLNASPEIVATSKNKELNGTRVLYFLFSLHHPDDFYDQKYTGDFSMFSSYIESQFPRLCVRHYITLCNVRKEITICIMRLTSLPNHLRWKRVRVVLLHLFSWYVMIYFCLVILCVDVNIVYIHKLQLAT